MSGYQHRQANNRSLSLSTGEHYQVEETSSLVSVSDQKLQNFHFLKKVISDEDGDETTTYQIIHKSGLIEILSNANDTYDTTVPIELYAPAGHLLKLLWTNFGGQPRLNKIQEGARDLLEINYTDVQVDIVRNPSTTEASTFSLVRANDRLIELKLPLGKGEVERATRTFTYETFKQGITCLSTVSGPAGLLEEVQYEEDGHRLPNGAPYHTMPYVLWHTVRPGRQQLPIETSYSFSAHNFLGYDGSQDWDDGKDNLYRVPDEYQYTSTVQIKGGTRTKYTYNKFHLILDTQHQKGTKQITQTIIYHALLNKAFEDQPAQYQLPKIVQTTYRDTATKASRIEMSQHTFDEWGNPTQEIVANGMKTDRVYYVQSGEKDAKTGQVYCPADPNGFQRYLREEIVTPAASAFTTPTRSKRYTYQQLPAANSACPTKFFVVAEQMQVLEGSQCISNTQFAYINQLLGRDHGRIQESTTLILGQFPKTRHWTYQYPKVEQLVTTVWTKAYDGLAIQEETGYSLSSGKIIFHKDPAGNQSVFTYDNIGRRIKVTMAPGTPYESTQQHEYAALKDGENEVIGCCVTVTESKGVKTRYLIDGLERVLQIESQDDDGRWGPQGNVKAYSGTFRLVQKRRYDALNQCIEVVDIDWLRGTKEGDTLTEQHSSQKFEYDDWGQKCRVTQGSGVVNSLITDPISLTHTEGIEGEGKTKTLLNKFGLPAQTTLLKKDSSIYNKKEYVYDGLGRLINQKDNSGLIKQLRYDCFDRITQIVWPDDHITKAEYAAQSAAALPASISVKDDGPFAKQAFDGFDRLVERTVSSRTTKQSYQGNEPSPTEITTPKGAKHHLTYNPTLHYVLTSLTSSDCAYTYQYDAQTARMTQLKDIHRTEEIKYLPSGMLSAKTVTDGGKTFFLQSTYSMAGRLECYTDMNGQKHEIRYDGFGRPQEMAQGKLKVTFSYDKADRLFESCAKDEDGPSVATRLNYDDFGREIERTVVQKGDSEQTLCRQSQTYDGIGLIATRVVKDGKGNLLRHESFKYDSLSRLVDYQCRSTNSWFPADERGNQIQRQQFTFDGYDSLTQVSTVFHDGSENIARYMYSIQDRAQVIKITNTHPGYTSQINLAYDANGCLTQDEQGRILEYDTMNRLATIRDGSNSNRILSQYRYDSTGKLVCQMIPGQPDTHLGYRGDTLIAVRAGESQVSYAHSENAYWGQTTSTTSTSQKPNEQSTSQKIELWISDSHQSILGSLDAGEISYRQYTPYGYSTTGPSLGFNGQWKDPVTGWYHLGNGYRVYNPVLMRFHTPDTWSPFESGETNAYTYCLGDPINLIDPSGHLSILGMELSGRDLVVAGVGIGVGLLVGVLTGGAGLAIAIGASVAVGAASDVATGAIYDVASGKSPTWESVGTDALVGVIGGLVGEGVGRVAGKGIEVFARRIGAALGRSGSLAITESAERQVARSVLRLDREVLHERQGITFFDSLGGVRGSTGLMTHGSPGQLMDTSGMMRRASEVAREVILPALERLRLREPDMEIQRIFTLLACHGFPDSGLAVSRVLQRPVKCFPGLMQGQLRSFNVALHTLEQRGGIERVFPGAVGRGEVVDSALDSAHWYGEPMDTT